MRPPRDAEALRAAVREWVRAQPDAVFAQAAETGAFGAAAVSGILATGLHRAPFPVAAGGLGLGARAYAAGLAEVAAVDGALAATVMASTSAALLILRGGTPEQQRRWLLPLLAGEGLAAIALTEAASGSDLAAVATRAEREDGGWRLSGSKVHVTLAASPMLRTVVTLARTGMGPAVLVTPADAPGVRLAGPHRGIGWSGAAVGDVLFQGCLVPEDGVLGVLGRGLPLVLGALNLGRLAVAAMACGLALGAFESALGRARGRWSFGRRLDEHEAVRATLVDMWVRAACASAVTMDAAARCDAGEDVRALAAMAKLSASDAAVANARAAVQVWGAEGTRAGAGPGGRVARMWGDAKVLEIVEGTSEIQRLVLARALDGVTPAGV